MKKRVFSGIQPTGDIHIGNYLGAMRNWVISQDEFENIFCIVDLHSITVQQDPKQLKAKTREVACLLLAAGIDPEKSALCVQSHIKEHTELAWILNCFTPMGWLQRMTQFKDKAHKQESVSAGLFDYPVLMAADILLYDTDEVPVGDDQKQHVELTRDIALRFNSIYPNTFRIPEPVIPKAGARIMGLDDPTVKMSKSGANRGHAVNLLDEPDEIRWKVKRATTDSCREIVFDEKRPGVYNLLTLYEVFSDKSRSQIEEYFSDKGYKELKEELAELIIEGIKPLRERYNQIAANHDYIDEALRKGMERVKPYAGKVINRVKGNIGLG